MRVKICGITSEEDARAAARAGADLLGLNFWSGSKRRCDPELARRIVDALPAGVTAVGVFVNPTVDEVRRVAAATGIACAQLHGDEPPALCAAMPLPVIKAIAVHDAPSLESTERFAVAALLLDSATAARGGSGVRFDWSLLARRRPALPFFLAGGLDPTNVAAAIRAVRPAGVDVASGVERAPGSKDPLLLARFVAAAKEA